MHLPIMLVHLRYRAHVLALRAYACAAISFFVLLSFFGLPFAPLAIPEQNENIRGGFGQFQKL